MDRLNVKKGNVIGLKWPGKGLNGTDDIQLKASRISHLLIGGMGSVSTAISSYSLGLYFTLFQVTSLEIEIIRATNTIHINHSVNQSLNHMLNHC